MCVLAVVTRRHWKPNTQANASFQRLTAFRLLSTPAPVWKNLADVFGTTIDFLVMGDNESKAQASLKDTELINQFKKISALPEEEKTLVLKMITAYIRDFNTQQAYAS